jgi:hypothetical protein
MFGPCLDHKYQTRVEVTNIEKLSSLPRFRINYTGKSFIMQVPRLDPNKGIPGTYTNKLFTAVIYGLL